MTYNAYQYQEKQKRESLSFNDLLRYLFCAHILFTVAVTCHHLFFRYIAAFI